MNLTLRIEIWLRERAALIITNLLLIAVGFVLYFGFIPFGWIVAYDIGKVYFLWPVLLLLTGCVMLAVARKRYKTFGSLQFFPLSAVATAILFFTLTLLSLSTTAVDWSLGWASFGIILLAITALLFSVGLIIFTELWRLFANQKVVEQVEQALADGSFRSRVEHQDWGSKHCLKIVHEYYMRSKRAVFKNIEDVGKAEACLKAGEDLRGYLASPWPRYSFPEQELLQEKANLLRELITLCLATRLRENKEWNRRVDSWIKEWDELYDYRNPYRQLLDLIFQLGREKQRSSDPIYIAKVTSQLWASFQLFAKKPSEDHQQRDLTIVTATWLSLAHYHIPSQVCFDLWMEMQELQKKELVVSDVADEYDLSIPTAYLFLTNWYAAWQEAIPPNWNQGLEGRAMYTRQLQRDMQEL